MYQPRKRSREKRAQPGSVPRFVGQSREIRIYRYYLALKHDRGYQYDYRKGWVPGPYMLIARQFRLPIREVKEIIEMQKRGHHGNQ